MSKNSPIQIISANRLRDGIIVFRDGAGNWVEQISLAAAFSGEAEMATELSASQADVKACHVVEVAAIRVVEDDGQWRALHIRDVIRINGPTIAPGEKLVASGKSTSAEEYTDVSI